MSYATLGQFPPIDPTQEELDALCRFIPCGSSLCPCPPGLRPGDMPGMIPRLPELTATAPAPWGWLALFVVALVVLSKPTGRKDW